jgi:glycosyltransferase involved in cell wall biosynthesis
MRDAAEMADPILEGPPTPALDALSRAGRPGPLVGASRVPLASGGSALHPRKEAARVALVIPTLNEEEAIGPLLARVPSGGADMIIVADGGSTDKTVERARALGAKAIEAGRGYGRACWQGALAAGDDCDIVVFMDGDGADKPELISRLVGPIAAGEADFVIGSRLRGSRAAGSMSFHQILAGLALGYAMRLAQGVRYTDMCAFRAIRRKSLMTLGMREMTYGWNIEMQMRAAAAKLRILELPVDYGLREGGVSKVAGSLRGTLSASTRIIATFFRVWREMRQKER